MAPEMTAPLVALAGLLSGLGLFLLGWRLGDRAAIRRVSFDVGTAIMLQEQRNRAVRNLCKGKNSRFRKLMDAHSSGPVAG